jgi:hypothetical protein
MVDAKVSVTLDGNYAKVKNIASLKLFRVHANSLLFDLQAKYRLGRALYYQGKIEDAQKTCTEALVQHADDKVFTSCKFLNFAECTI